jgi:hypothetical protein
MLPAAHPTTRGPRTDSADNMVVKLFDHLTLTDTTARKHASQVIPTAGHHMNYIMQLH